MSAIALTVTQFFINYYRSTEVLGAFPMCSIRRFCIALLFRSPRFCGFVRYLITLGIFLAHFLCPHTFSCVSTPPGRFICRTLSVAVFLVDSFVKRIIDFWFVRDIFCWLPQYVQLFFRNLFIGVWKILLVSSFSQCPPFPLDQIDCFCRHRCRTLSLSMLAEHLLFFFTVVWDCTLLSTSVPSLAQYSMRYWSVRLLCTV